MPTLTWRIFGALVALGWAGIWSASQLTGTPLL